MSAMTGRWSLATTTTMAAGGVGSAQQRTSVPFYRWPVSKGVKGNFAMKPWLGRGAGLAG